MSEATVAPGEIEEAPLPVSESHLTRKKLFRFGVSFLTLAAVIWYLPRVADFSTVWEYIKDMTPLELVILAAFAAWNLVTYWIQTVLATPGMNYPKAMVVTESSTAIANTVPAGSALAIGLQYSMMSSWGFSKSRTTVSLMISGIWNNFVKLGMPILALALLAFSGEAGGGRVVAGIFGVVALVVAVVVFAAILRSEAYARRFGEWFGRLQNKPRRWLKKEPAHGFDDALAKFRGRIIGIVRKRWLPLTFWSLVGHLSLYVVLLVTLRDVGVSQEEVSWIEVLAVFAFVRLLTAIPLTPGGVGIVEVGLISGLSKAGGNEEQIVAAVLVFRLLTYVVPIIFGLITYLFWRRNKSWLNSAPPLEPEFTATADASAG